MAADLARALALGVLGLLVGALVDRAAGRFPWSQPPLNRRSAVRSAVVSVTTAVLFVLVGMRFGASWELPPFLVLVGAGVLLALIDLRHHLLPDRVVLPSLGLGVVLLAVAASGEGSWPALGRALLAARRIGLKNELPFGPAMLIGAALVIAGGV